ncbi:MAG: outer membrane beta-barrel protein [Nitrospira sp.]|nr:outer membrane beta-barrel protein [Nitrospira sp.]
MKSHCRPRGRSSFQRRRRFGTCGRCVTGTGKNRDLHESLNAGELFPESSGKTAGRPLHEHRRAGRIGRGIKSRCLSGVRRGIAGVEGELSGLTGKVDAPTATTGGVTRSANFRLQSINAMANLLLRYPGEIIQPYIGVGAGLSGGFARDLNLQHSTIGVIRENAADGAFAYQFLGGVRANVNERVFLFTEYKYFVANYQWESELANGAHGPSFTLNYRTHIISGGIGFRL